MHWASFWADAAGGPLLGAAVPPTRAAEPALACSQRPAADVIAGRGHALAKEGNPESCLEEQGNVEDDQINLHELAQMQLLKEEVRFLRLENASLLTGALGATGVPAASANEAPSLAQLGRFLAEVQDCMNWHRGGVQDLRQQPVVNSAIPPRLAEDTRRLDQRAQEAEERASRLQSQVLKLEMPRPAGDVLAA